MTTKQLKRKLALLTKEATTRAQAAGLKVDAALVALGKAARNRQRRRARKAGLKIVRTTAVIAGTAAAAVLATRLAQRGRNS